MADDWANATGYHCHMLWDCFSGRISGIAALVCLAGCAGPVDEVPFTLIGQPKPTVADPDLCDAAQDCAARLVKNANRDWIGVPQSADGYSNGTRLFAYRGLRRKLTCGELQLAIEDTKAAMSTLEKASYERARALAGEVMRELATEQGKRCNRRADSIDGHALPNYPRDRAMSAVVILGDKITGCPGAHARV